MLGFKLTSTGEFLGTQGVTISYTLKSPVFRDNDNDGSFIFNTSIPATDNNKRICKFPLRIEAYREMTVEEPIQVYFNGLVIWEGTMIAKFARPDEIEISIGLGRGEFNHEAKDKKLKDVVPDETYQIGTIQQQTDPGSGIVQDIVTVDFDDNPSKVYPEVNYCIAPMKIEDMCSSMGNAFNNAYYNTASLVNAWDMELQKFMSPLLTGNHFIQENFTDDQETHTHHLTYLLAYNIFIPLPYNSWILKHLFNNMGYVLLNNPFETNDDLKRLIVYNIQTINSLKNTNEGPWTQWVDATGDDPGYTLTTKRYLYALQAMMSFNLRNHVPDVLVKDYIRSLENMFFIRFFFDEKSKTVTVKFLKDIILDNNYEDITSHVTDIKERKMEYERIASLVQNFDSNDGNNSYIKTKEEIQEFDRINDVWYYGDLPANPFGQYENKISYGQLQRKWFVCSSFADDFNHTSLWDFLAFEHYPQMKLLSKGKEWETNASAIACSHFVDYKPGTSYVKYGWHLPSIKQALRFYNAYKTKENTCGLRFLFYRGKQKGNLVKLEPKIIATISHTNDIVSGGIIYDAIGYLVNNSPISQQAAAQACWHIADGGMTLAEAQSYLLSFYSLNNDIDQTVFQNFFNYYVYTYETVIQVSDEEKLYPLLTNDVYDGQLTKIPEANLSLKWDGQYGIYERFAKEFITWYNTMAKPVTILMQPTVEDLFMDFSVKKRINGIDYLLDEIRGEITGDKLSVAEVDAWSC